MADAGVVARSATTHSTHMPECRSNWESNPSAGAARRPAVRERLLIGLVAIALVRAGEALAGEQTSESAAAGAAAPGDARQSTILPSYWFGAPQAYSIPAVPEGSVYSKEEFRPRGPSVYESGAQAGSGGDSLIGDSTAWQRLSEFRTRDRVRVLTLWKSGLSAVSLQAGKRGSPSLQWTSKLMNSGEAARGLLDRWLPAESSGGAGESARGEAHPLARWASTPPGARGEPGGKASATLSAVRPGLP